MNDKESSPQLEAIKSDLSEAEIAKRFEDTVRRMANTKPAPKPKPDTTNKKPRKHDDGAASRR